MKKLLLVTAITVVFGNGAVNAADSVMNLGAVSDNICVLGTSTLTAEHVFFGSNADALVSAGEGDELVVTFADSYCNYAHNVSLKSEYGALRNQYWVDDQPPTGFVEIVDYTATLTGWAENPALNTSTLTQYKLPEVETIGTTAEFRNDGDDGPGGIPLTLTVVLVPNETTPLLAGKYDDILTLKIGPTF